MENAVEALMLAFAVMMLVLALSLTIYVFSQARQTSELMLKLSDPTEYYEYYDYYSISTNNDALGNRIVGIETIIPTLYKYSKERYKVTFRNGTIEEGETITDENGDSVTLIEVRVGDPIVIYETTTNPDDWKVGYLNDFSNSDYDKRICSFDIDDEIKRGECWTADIKNHLDAIISGGKYLKPQYNDKNLSDLSQDEKDKYTIDYGVGLLERFKDARFVELVGEISNKATNETEDDENEGIVGNKTTTKKVITYVLLPKEEGE